MNDDERSEHIRSSFNDAAREGYPVRLTSRSEPPEDVVPVVLSMANGLSAQYYRVYDKRTVHEFVPSRFTGISSIPRVAKVELIDGQGRVLNVAPPDLSACRLRFTLRGVGKGDVYRVEILSGPTTAAHKIEQTVAGTHVDAVQNFDVPLRGSARSEVMISICRVDRQTAKRDPNAKGPTEWKETFRVSP